MRYKERVIKLIKATLFCALLICIISYTAGILEGKASLGRYGAFYYENSNVDVLFLGTSHAMDSVYPMELWNDYGITSYNLAGESTTFALNYWVLKNALRYSKPKLVVLDGSGLAMFENKVNSLSYMHKQIDLLSLNGTKIAMIYDLLDNWDDRLEFICKFSLYHSRWDELTENDFKSNEEIIDELNKGARMQIKVAIPEVHSKLDKDDKLGQDVLEQYPYGIEYISKIIEECQSEGIEILLTYLPFPAPEDRQREANTVRDIASEYGINYVNFLELDVVNLNTDCHDAVSHLNAAGARKVTDFLGDYITKNYDVADHRQDAAYTSWNDDYDAYMDYKTGRLKEQQELDRYLMMLSDKNLNCCIYIDGNVADVCDERMKELITNISKYKTLDNLDDAIDSGKSYFLIVDNGQSEIFESVDGEAIDILNTTFGHVEFGKDEGGAPYLYIQDGENNYIDVNSSVSAAVINKYTKSVIDTSHFAVYDKLHYGIKSESGSKQQEVSEPE